MKSKIKVDYLQAKVDKGIEIPAQQRVGSASVLAKSMLKGDSVFFYNSSNANYLASQIRHLGYKATVRAEFKNEERIGYRTWKR